MSGSLRPPRSPNIIWPSLSSNIIFYGHQWPETSMRPNTSNIQISSNIENVLFLLNRIELFSFLLVWFFQIYYPYQQSKETIFFILVFLISVSKLNINIIKICLYCLFFYFFGGSCVLISEDKFSDQSFINLFFAKLHCLRRLKVLKTTAVTIIIIISEFSYTGCCN